MDPNGAGRIFLLLIQTLPTCWAERILILRIFIFTGSSIFVGSQISRPGLGQAWAGPGLDTARVDLVGPELDWTGPGPGLCLLDVLNMFPPLMKKPPIFSVPWFLEASFVFP